METIYRTLMQRRRAASLVRRASETAPCPIISVGNLTVGGTGKTPMVQWLARALQNDGWRVGIAARGYGGTQSEIGALVGDGKAVLLSAHEAGDEAVSHARNLPAALIAVAKNRHLAVEICVQNGAQIVILDDGFQFWSLPRAFDIVLIDAKSPFGNGHLLPWGRLREERAALSRADVVILTRTNRIASNEIGPREWQIEENTSAPIFFSDHAPRDLRDEKTGEILPLSFLRRRDIKACAGLADNAQFYDALQSIGAGQITRLKRERGDHHRWQKADFEWFRNAPQINAHQAEIFARLPVITTEKDATKLDPNWFDGPLFSLRIALEIEDEAALLALVRGKIAP